MIYNVVPPTFPLLHADGNVGLIDLLDTQMSVWFDNNNNNLFWSKSVTRSMPLYMQDRIVTEDTVFTVVCYSE